MAPSMKFGIKIEIDIQKVNNYHTTNKCTNCMSFIFKSLF